MVTIPAQRREVIGTIMAYRMLAERLCDKLKALGMSSDEIRALGSDFILELKNKDYQGMSYQFESDVVTAGIASIEEFFGSDEGAI